LETLDKSNLRLKEELKDGMKEREEAEKMAELVK